MHLDVHPHLHWHPGGWGPEDCWKSGRQSLVAGLACLLNLAVSHYFLMSASWPYVPSPLQRATCGDGCSTPLCCQVFQIVVF